MSFVWKQIFVLFLNWLFLFFSSVLGPGRPVAVLVIATCAELKLDERIARRSKWEKGEKENKTIEDETNSGYTFCK